MLQNEAIEKLKYKLERRNIEPSSSYLCQLSIVLNPPTCSPVHYVKLSYSLVLFELDCIQIRTN